jgi:hypothetical protein
VSDVCPVAAMWITTCCFFLLFNISAVFERTQVCMYVSFFYETHIYVNVYSRRNSHTGSVRALLVLTFAASLWHDVSCTWVQLCTHIYTAFCFDPMFSLSNLSSAQVGPGVTQLQHLSLSFEEVYFIAVVRQLLGCMYVCTFTWLLIFVLFYPLEDSRA